MRPHATEGPSLTDSHTADKLLLAMPMKERDRLTIALWETYGRNRWSVAEVKDMQSILLGIA